MSEPKTFIERHTIGGHGKLLSFVEASKTLGASGWKESEASERIREVAKLDDDAGRKLALSLIEKLDRMRAEADEMRKRFCTIHTALIKINDSLKSEGAKS